MVGVFSLCPQMSRHVPLRPLNVNQGIRRDKMTLARKDTIGVLKAAEANQVSMLFENMLTMEELLLMLKHQYCRRTVYRWIAQDVFHLTYSSNNL